MTAGSDIDDVLRCYMQRLAMKKSDDFIESGDRKPTRSQLSVACNLAALQIAVAQLLCSTLPENPRDRGWLTFLMVRESLPLSNAAAAAGRSRRRRRPHHDR